MYIYIIRYRPKSRLAYLQSNIFKTIVYNCLKNVTL